ncbi:hypothetical protein [Fibrella forsythiae]|uniref:Anti-sigma factor n=1 Tax=Fibrella forsythiae TaxID=2817061 RepID=A0ABS3JLN7_9BACT|nr:hypothetical protein [Fibrella forsythiae]MBO0950913.1 hypothetical protein [Fibrella forsythiae]
MTSDEKDNLLDRYVSGQPMSADEEAQVDQLVTTDPDFKIDYILRRELFETGKRERRAAWEAGSQVRSLPVKRTMFPMRWIAAASVILLLGIGLVWWIRPFDDDQPFSGQALLFEQQGTQLGLAGQDSLAVGTVAWVVTKAPDNAYEFSQLDTLRIFTTSPDLWKDQDWQLTSLSEVRYRLRVGNRTYALEQGRSIRLPLNEEK